MRKVQAVVGSAIFLVIAPGVIAGLIPWLISGWHEEPPLFGVPATRFIGVIFVLLGIPVLLDSFARFAIEGLGTPAPIFPTRTLVVRGFYRYVRNPMYVSVILILFGQGLFFGDLRLIAYGLFLWLVTHLFVVVYEEPTLRKSFGAQYERYCASVPRWIPRPAKNTQ
jgi:protein-S-isoprenylcysteine O-methyltransferase Ste14